MLCFSTPHFQTRCGLAVLNLRKGYGPPFAKNRTSFTTSDASDAENRRPAALPYAGCAPYSTGTEKQLSPSRSPQNRPRPRFAPRRPLVAEQAMACSGRNPRVRSTRGFLRLGRACVESLHPRWGTDPSLPGQGPVWATQGRVWQKSPEKQESQFPSSASLRLETKHTVVSNPHTPPF